MNQIEQTLDDATLEELLSALDRHQAMLENRKLNLQRLEQDCYDARKGISKLNMHIADLGVAIARKTQFDNSQPE
jgi:hypothetical protein